MCKLCTESAPDYPAHKNELEFSAKLAQLADAYRGLGNGAIKPHSDNWFGFRAKARAVIRKLVEDWV